MMKILAFAFVLLAVPCVAQDVVQAEPHALLIHVSLVSFMAAEGADLSTTMYALGARTGREANPVFAIVTGKPKLAGAVKMGIAAGTAWGLLKLHKTNPKTATVLAMAGTVFYAGLALHNARITGQ